MSSQDPSRAGGHALTPLPRLEDLPRAGEGYDRDKVGEAFEAFRKQMDYYAHAPTTAATLERLAREQPRTLACMHGSAWRGDGASLLRALAKSLAS